MSNSSTQTEAQDVRRIRFDPTVNLGHLLTFVGFLITIFTAWSNLDRRVTVNETWRVNKEVMDAQLDARDRETMQAMRADVIETRRAVEQLARQTNPNRP
jgi:hypothetical protein